MNLDLRLDEEDGDLYVNASGDVEFIDSTEQNIEDILISNPGSFKEFPFIGVGIQQYQNSDIANVDLTRLIKLGLEADNFQNIEIEITEDKQIFVNGNRKN